MCHNTQTAALFSILSFSHVLQYTPFSLNFNALHFRHSYTSKRGCAKNFILTQPLTFFIRQSHPINKYHNCFISRCNNSKK